MAMAEILDSVRKIIYRWVNTISPITENISIGDTILTLQATRRFEIGDQVMIKNAEIYETSLIVKSIIDDNQLELTTTVLNNWEVDGNNTVLIKTINEQFVQSIYIGDPNVIARYPAITVNGASRNSEWMTLESTKERYEIEIGVYVQAAMHEKGYRFLLETVDMIQKGLKRNILPLVDDYNVTSAVDSPSIINNLAIGDVNIEINNVGLVGDYRYIIFEDNYNMQENWIVNVFPTSDPSGRLDDGPGYIHLADPICYNFNVEDTTIILPRRFVFNSWPSDIDYGTIHKGELLKAGVINWFAEEEEMQYYRRDELKLK